MIALLLTGLAIFVGLMVLAQLVKEADERYYDCNNPKGFLYDQRKARREGLGPMLDRTKPYEEAERLRAEFERERRNNAQ
jgi:hypothetical protein